MGRRRSLRPPRRPEAPEVAPHEVCGAMRAADHRRPQPVVGGSVQVRPAPLPGAGGRHPDQLEPEADAPRGVLPDQLLNLGAAQRTACEGAPDPCRRRRHGPRFRRVDADPPATPGVADGQRKRPVVARGDEVDGRAHQRPLRHRSPLERPRQPGALEALDPRPEPDVHRRGVLRLEAGHALERPGQGERFPPEEQLAGEQSAIQLTPRERPLLGQPAHLTAAKPVSPGGSRRSR